MICRDFLAQHLEKFEDRTKECPLLQTMLKYVTMVPITNFDGVVVHHSGSMLASSPKAIAKWSYDAHGWPMPYHFVLPRDGEEAGKVFLCKSLEVRGPHCGSYYGNLRMLAICLEGDFTKENPSDEQVGQFGELLYYLEEWKGSSFGVVPHRAISNTACPGRLFEHLNIYM